MHFNCKQNANALQILLMYDCYWELEKAICGFDFVSITRASNFGMAHLVSNDCQNLVWPHYGKYTNLVVVLMGECYHVNGEQ